MYVLHTDTVIYFFKGEGNVAKNLLAIPPREIGIPAVAVYELHLKLFKLSDATKRQEQLNKFIQTIQTLTFGVKEAKEATKIRANLEDLGIAIAPHEVLIAATALAHNHTLVTHDTNRFQKIKKLTLADWY